MIKNFLYDKLLTPFTTQVNKYFLEKCDENSKIIDIGIGTGTALLNNHEIIRNKNLDIVGYDIDKDYVAKCNENIKEKNMENYIKVKPIDIRDDFHVNLADYIVFSDSYAVIPDIDKLIKYCKELLKSNGKIIILTTLDDDNCQEWHTNYKKYIKPKLVYFCGADFGNMTTMNEFKNRIDKLKMNVIKLELIINKWYFMYGQVKTYYIELY